MRTGALVMALFVIFCGPQASLADADPSSYLKNRQALEAIEKKDLQDAQAKIIEALSTNPLDAKLHLNLGLTFELLAQPEKAKASYEQALKLAEDSETLFAANFDLGQLAQKARKTDEALQFYQQALRFNPDSKETKINIELLIQQNEDQQKKDQQQKDQSGQGQGQDQKNQQDPQDSKDPKNDPKDSKDQKEKQPEPQQQQQQQQQAQKPKQEKQPPKFKSEELTPGDAKKILGEIKQQEEKIRAEFNRKTVKEQPLEKDW